MNGIDAALIAFGLLILLAVERYAAWKSWDHYRRLERHAHRNLYRGCGCERP